MEHFTQSITDDFADYNMNRESSINGRVSETSTLPREGETQVTMKDIDIDAILNRAPIRLRHRRSRPLEEAPEFVQRLTSFAEVRAGEDVVFTCQWKAFPMPSVRWYRDDEEITESTDARHVRESGIDGTETLHLSHAGKKDEGAYKCRVENQEGVAATTGYLSVTGDVTDKTLSSIHKKNKSEHSISSAPHLRTIVEQKSVEEREDEQASGQDPSPIQTFIDNFRREKTWPMHGTGYDPAAAAAEDDALSTGSADSLTSEPTTPDLEDYDHVSFQVRDMDPPHGPNHLSVEAMIRAPSIEDIMGEIEAREKDGEFAATEEFALKCQQDYNDSTDEDTCPTPTNFLDEPVFVDTTSQANAAEEDTTTPGIEITENISQGILQLKPHEVARERNLVRSPQTTVTQNTAASAHRESPAKAQFELWEIPVILSVSIGDLLDLLPLLYYLLFTSCSAALAVATDMPVPCFVLLVALLSMLSFTMLRPQPHS